MKFLKHWFKSLTGTTKKMVFVLLIMVLLFAVFLNNNVVNKAIDTQNKLIEYLVVLDLYDLISEQQVNSAKNYVIQHDPEYLYAYKYIVNNELKGDVINELFRLGVTLDEDELIHQAIYLCTQLKQLELKAIEAIKSPMGLLVTDLHGEDSRHTTGLINSAIFSKEYIDLKQQHREIMTELRNSIINRMSNAVERIKNRINIAFYLVTFMASFVPVLLFINNSKANKFTEKINKDKELQELTLKNVREGIIAVDINGVINIFNPAAEEITGVPFDEAIGRHVNDIIKIKDNAFSFCDHVSRDKSECRTKSYYVNFFIVDRNGNEKYVTKMCSKISEEDDRLGMVFTLMDTTEKLAMDNEKAKNQRLESLGRLAGGIAHDFNNSLTVIGGHTGLSKLFIASGKQEKVAPSLSIIEEEVEKAHNLTNKLLTFAKGGMPVKSNYNLYNLLRESVDMVLGDSPTKYTIKTSNTDQIVYVDYGLMSQVFSNIFRNAKEAMSSQDDQIWVEVSDIDIDEKHEYLEAGSYSYIKIVNNGEQIPDSDMESLFEPYFSTKGGEGLGLATSYSIIKNHQGYIKAESNADNTTFTIYLPNAEDILEEEVTTEVQQINKALKVLIMDDEKRIRELNQNILKELGHEADTAPNGETAIKMYKEKYETGEPYHLLLLDLMVANGMGGKEALTEILKIDPNAKAIVSSGYSNDAVMANYKDHGFIDVLPKPYNYEQLIEILNKIDAT